MKKFEGELFAVVAPGLEGVCARELSALGMQGVVPVEGGVVFTGGLAEIYRANLWLRTASRVLVRLGAFRSRDFPDLFKKAVRLPWGRFIRQGTRIRVRATSHRSRLGHSDRIAETVGEAIDRALGGRAELEAGPEQIVLVRFDEDSCLISVDSSGELLHRRGYREETAHAPLRETLAAGILYLLQWDRRMPLVDPMCGSGTFVIEGALMAANLPPGGARRFAFMDWPGFRPGLWQAVLSEAVKARSTVEGAIRGSDRDSRALEAARRNARRAGVEGLIRFEQADLAEISSEESEGLILCNPPYGERLGKDEDLRPLYGTLGRIYRDRFPGWRRAVLCPSSPLVQALDLPLETRAQLVNGGIRVSLFQVEGFC